MKTNNLEAMKKRTLEYVNTWVNSLIDEVVLNKKQYPNRDIKIYDTKEFDGTITNIYNFELTENILAAHNSGVDLENMNEALTSAINQLGNGVLTSGISDTGLLKLSVNSNQL